MSEEVAPDHPAGIRALGALVTGTVLAQVIQFAASLLLTRLYVPAEYGQYASILSLATVLGSVFALSYPAAIPLAKTDEESRVLVWLGMALASLAAMITTLVLGVILVTGTIIVGYQPDPIHLVLVPGTAFAVSLWTTMQYRQARLGRFSRISLATASGASVQVAVQIGAGGLGYGAPGLSVGYLLGRFVNVGLLVRGSRLGRLPRLTTLIAVARDWSKMPRWLLLTNIMGLLGTTAITPWVAHNYGLATAGLFAFSLQMLSVPAALIGQAVTTILFPRFAQTERTMGGVSVAQMERYVTSIASVAFIAFVPVLVLGPELFALVFGDDWRGAGLIASVLTPWMATNFVSSPLSSLAVVKGRLPGVAFVAALETIARFLTILVGALVGSELVGFGLYSAAGVAISINYLVWTFRLSGGSLARLVRRHIRVCILASTGVLVLLGARLVAPVSLVFALTTIFTVATGAPVMRRLWSDFALERPAR